MTKQSVKITINLNQKEHDESQAEIQIDDILWVSGHIRRPGCTVVLRQGKTFRSTDSSIDIRKAIDRAKVEDNIPFRG